MDIIRKPFTIAKALVPHLECPICLIVPRDGIMLTCLNGHGVCSGCKDKLGERAKCPMGRCDFGNPPARNVTVANLVGRFPFEWECKFKSVGDCTFEGTRRFLEPHEASCKNQLFRCPVINCELVSFGSIIEHTGGRHKRIGKVDYPTPGEVASWLTPNVWSSEAFSWLSPGLEASELERESALCSLLHDGQLFLWIWVPMDDVDAMKTVGLISLVRTDYYWVFIVVPVYSGATLNRKKVLREENRVGPQDFFVKKPVEVQGVNAKHWREEYTTSIYKCTFYKRK